MGRAPTICAIHGCPHQAVKMNRCPQHAAEREAHQRRTTPTKIHEPRDRKRRAKAVAAHRAQFGNWCPGYKRPPHQADDLTAQHVDAVADVGHAAGQITVWCRSCNSRHGQEVSMRAR